ncbi:hypothetical protein Amico_0963 [Aminobacterium colombiense DSM 12261]|uniref:DUF1850 domain-containing protein n=2 Tax=Aminobacteriaceae TaxID=3029087 RepID=D5EEV6_AMICL|nr:hypothetical protein Amico_0963 [Aminobacterium colombiense DSM 12261]NLK30846.1 DUF1850 domain-containing protein [Aminobacterium colombiense]
MWVMSLKRLKIREGVRTSKRWTSNILISLILFSAFYLLFIPVHFLSFRTQDWELCSALAPSGVEIKTGYIHSVEKTPVEDVYVLSGPRLWLWEERFRSHNAGLPTEPPPRGRFLLQKDWMVIRGSPYTWEVLRIRIGDDELGKNWVYSSTTGKLDLYQLIPNNVFYIEVTQVPLLFRKR